MTRESIRERARRRRGQRTIEVYLRRKVQQASTVLGLYQHVGRERNPERAYLDQELVSVATARTSGVGPILLDCAMARRHGWTGREIVRVALILGAVSRFAGSAARRRHPEWYARGPDGMWIFTRAEVSDGR